MEQTNSAMPKPEGPVFTVRDVLALAAALGLAVLWFSVFSLDAIFSAKHLPGLGAAAFTTGIWAAVLLYLGAEARWSRHNIFLAASVGALTFCCLRYADDGVKAVNYLLIAGGSALCFFDLPGASRRTLTEALVVTDAAAQTFWALFVNWGKPFRALGALGEGGKKTARQALLGLLAAIPLLALVLYLLSDADAVFGSLFTGLAAWLRQINAASLGWRVLRTLVLTLMLFSALYFLRHTPEWKKPEGKSVSVSATAPAVVLGSLIVVYIIFVFIQFAYLFGGGETAAMEGGYAQYARSGFFQLVWVSCLNLALALSCAGLGNKETIIKIMSTILLILTAIILFSAFWRMRLYILAYGLSLKRAMTLWAMAFIAVCLALAAVRIWRPGFRFWPFFAAVGLAGWILFNLVNIDARIADYNVDAYLAGRTESVDIYYLSNLSPDALPALERLREAEGGAFKGAGDSDFYLECDLDDAIRNACTRNFTPERWPGWTISWAIHKEG